MRFINKMNLVVVENLILYRDNEISIALTKNMESQYQTKHIKVQHYYIRELVNKKEPTIKWILGSKMLADKMTKTLPTMTFRNNWVLLGLTIGCRERLLNKKSLIKTVKREIVKQEVIDWNCYLSRKVKS